MFRSSVLLSYHHQMERLNIDVLHPLVVTLCQPQEHIFQRFVAIQHYVTFQPQSLLHYYGDDFNDRKVTWPLLPCRPRKPLGVKAKDNRN